MTGQVQLLSQIYKLYVIFLTTNKFLNIKKTNQWLFMLDA